MRGDPHGTDGFEGVVRRRRLRPHGYEVALALDNWMERYAYLTGSYYDPTTIATLQSLLRAGDVFVDVGANIGLVSLSAASFVGENGRVLAFEPNKRLVDRLRATLEFNTIGNVSIFNVALGDENASGYLDTSAQHGTGSLRSGAGDKVAIVRGADQMPDLPAATRIVIKIDVEGYEYRVISGFLPVLERSNVALLVEVTDKWLRDLGSSAQRLFDDLMRLGYAAYVPRMDWRSRLRFDSISGPIGEFQYDVLFARPQDRWLGSEGASNT